MEVRSKHGILIRLTEERWNHIIDEHGELAELRREVDEDGFVITAFLTRRFRSLDRRTQLWP